MDSARRADLKRKVCASLLSYRPVGSVLIREIRTLPKESFAGSGTLLERIAVERERAVGDAALELDRVGRGAPQKAPQHSQLRPQGITLSDPRQRPTRFHFHPVGGVVNQGAGRVTFRHTQLG